MKQLGDGIACCDFCSSIKTILASTMLAMAAIAPASAANIASPTTPYATISWPDRLNPRFVGLGNDYYLLETRTGMQVWDAGHNTFSAATQWPLHVTPRHLWTNMDKGRLVVGGSNADTRFESLIWWNGTKQTFSKALALPAGALIMHLLPLGPQYALVCMRIGYFKNSPTSIDFDKLPTRAVIVGLASGQLRLIADSSTPMQEALVAAGVRGKVEGSAAIADDTKPSKLSPLLFNTQNCNWEMRNPPAELANRPDLTIKHQRLPDGRLLVSHASWYENAQGRHANLTAPYLWEAQQNRWVPIANTAQSGNQPSIFHSYGVDDPVVAVTTVNPKFIEFLDPKSLRWTRSAQDLPIDTYGPVPAPMADGSALVFLSENGHILRLTPMIATPDGLFAFGHYYLGEVPLSHGGLLLASGGSRWDPSNRPEILRTYPTAAAKSIAPLPKPLGYVAGLELKDNTILVFGGLPARCSPSSMFFECKDTPAQPSYRYFPQDDRWDEVPGLALRFANGEAWDFGNADISTQWPRNDVMVRRNGDVVLLDGPTSYQVGSDMTPKSTRLLAWRPGAAPTPLATLTAARTAASLIELNDGRLAVAGGNAAKTLVSTNEQCSGCDDASVSSGAMESTRTTEVFSSAKGKWRAGPIAHYEGGRALKLANGRIFKLSLARRFSAEDGYRAEIANAAFTHWKTLPALPVKGLRVKHVTVAENRVLIVMDGPTGTTVVWDEQRAAWLVWKHWTKENVLSVTPIDAKHAIARTSASYEVLAYPE